MHRTPTEAAVPVLMFLGQPHVGFHVFGIRSRMRTYWITTFALGQLGLEDGRKWKW
jgi:hypothetical protein